MRAALSGDSGAGPVNSNSGHQATVGPRAGRGGARPDEAGLRRGPLVPSPGSRARRVSSTPGALGAGPASGGKRARLPGRVRAALLARGWKNSNVNVRNCAQWRCGRPGCPGARPCRGRQASAPRLSAHLGFRRARSRASRQVPGDGCGAGTGGSITTEKPGARVYVASRRAFVS